MGYELFYSTGGHGGPYPDLDTARRRARALLKGNRDEWWIKIRKGTDVAAPVVDIVRKSDVE